MLIDNQKYKLAVAAKSSKWGKQNLAVFRILKNFEKFCGLSGLSGLCVQFPAYVYDMCMTMCCAMVHVWQILEPLENSVLLRWAPSLKFRDKLKEHWEKKNLNWHTLGTYSLSPPKSQFAYFSRDTVPLRSLLFFWSYFVLRKEHAYTYKDFSLAHGK